jgi:hypothetical protein
MYKKLFVAMVAVAASITANAQTQKGSQLLGGSLSFGFSQEKGKRFNGVNTYNAEDKTSYFGIGPDYSYFIADNLDLGANAGYSYNKSETSDSYNATGAALAVRSRAFSVGMNLRKYFLYDGKIGIRTGPFVQYVLNKQTPDNFGDIPGRLSNDIYDIKTIAGGLGLDIAFFPTRHLGFTTSIGSVRYRHSNNKGSYGDTRTNGMDLSFMSSGLTISAFYAFGK